MKKPFFLPWLLATLLLIAASASAADSPYIYGIHWYGDQNSSDVEAMSGNKPLWVLETVNLYDGGWTMNDQAAKFQAIANKGHTIVIRLQPRWGWSIPASAERAQYLNDVQAAAQQAANFCHIWQIGNEMNLYDEYGGGVLTAQEYTNFYKEIRQRIKAVTSPKGPQIVLVGPVSPGAYYQEVRHTEGLTYLDQMCSYLTSADTDGFALHAYGAPWLDAAGARNDLRNGYSTQLSVIDNRGFCNKPAYILEWNRQTNPLTDAWQEEQTARFIIGAYQDLQAWNANSANHPIVCATWFIYPDFGGWEIFSLRKLRDYNSRGVNYDVWDSFQYACGLNIAAGSSSPSCSGIVVDNDAGAPGFTTTGTWSTSASSGYNGGSYRYAVAGGAHNATWTATLAQSGTYEVEVIYRSGTNRASSARYVVTHKNGSTNVNRDQTQNNLVWVSLGNFQYNAGSATVQLQAAPSTAAGKVVIADAVRFRRTGALPTPTPTPSPTPSPTPTATPTPTPTPVQSNVVINGGFESGFTNGVGNNWTSWSGSWSNPITFGSTSFTKYEGSFAQYWGRTDANRIHGGIYQRITGLTNGAQYRIQAKMRRFAGASDQWMEFGYDLTGGTAAEASSVTYTKLEGGGTNVWVNYDVTVTATGSAITLFAKGGHYNQDGSGNNYYYIDAVTMIRQ